MIFVTIGTQEPFDRLLKAMDRISQMLHGVRVVAQVCNSTYKVQNMETHAFLTPIEFNKYFSQADLIVSHAGMGTIISALVQEKPILIMPRLPHYNEVRNSHQIATAEAFKKLEFVHVANDENDLEDKVVSMMQKKPIRLSKVGAYASKDLLESLQEFIVSKPNL